MKINGLISVVMPVYNCDSYLREAIQSILDQTYKQFELIIVEDGSKDGTRSIVEEFASVDNRIHPIYKEINRGVPGYIANLNEVVGLAQGEFIARMDGDDISLPDRFAKQVEFLRNNPGIFLVGTSAINISPEGEFISYTVFPTDATKIQKDLERKNSIYHPTVMFRNDGTVKYRLNYAEDYDLWLQLIKSGKQLTNLAEPLLKYRTSTGSLSRGDSLKNVVASLVAQQIYRGELSFEEYSLDPDKFISRFLPENIGYTDAVKLFELALTLQQLKIAKNCITVINKDGVDFTRTFRLQLTQLRVYLAIALNKLRGIGK